jgi:hypothetical protein
MALDFSWLAGKVMNKFGHDIQVNCCQGGDY